MTAPFANGPRAARPALLPPTWPPYDPETGQFDLSDEAGPPDGFFVDPDVAMRIAEATAIAEGLSPAEAWRDSNRKRSELGEVQWDLAVRRRAYEEAQAFSFDDPADGAQPVFAELSPEDAASLDTFSGFTNLQVDFPPEHGGYIARVYDPVENVEIGRFPRKLVLNVAEDMQGSGTVDAEANISDPARDSDDEGGWFSRFLPSDRIRDIVLDALPGIGNVRSGMEAYESYRKAIEAVEREDWNAFLKHGGMGLLNTLGAVGGPLSAPLVRLAKIGIRQLVRATPGAREAAAAHSLYRAKKRADAPYPSVPLQKAVGNVFRRLSNDQKKTLRGLFPGVLGRAGERHAVRLLEDAGQTVTTKASKTTTKVDMGGRTVKRRYDGLIEQVQHNFFVDAFKIFRPHTRTAAIEAKVGASRLGRQKKIDQAMEADGSFAQEAVHLRFSVKNIPEKDFEHAVRQLFAKHVSSGKFSAKEVDRIVGGFKRLRRGHGDWATGEVVVGLGARMVANRYARQEEERRRNSGERWRKDAGYHGEAIDRLMTGA